MDLGFNHISFYDCIKSSTYLGDFIVIVMRVSGSNLNSIKVILKYLTISGQKYWNRYLLSLQRRQQTKVGFLDRTYIGTKGM